MNVALSGTLETFSLPDVLQLLSSTKKTGCLALDGDRGTGQVWVEDGEIVAARADRSVVDEVDAVLFELLRYTDAAFEFDAGSTADAPGEPREVASALELAQERLEEWREIEAVVPSLDVRVRMVPELDGAVEVDPTSWRLLARIGTGASGHDVAQHVGEGEFDVCRSLRDLVDAGMVEVTELEAPAAPEPLAVADAFAAMVHAPAVLPEPEHVGFDAPLDEVDAPDDLFAADETADLPEPVEHVQSDAVAEPDVPEDVELDAELDGADEAVASPYAVAPAAEVAPSPADELAAIFGPPAASEPAGVDAGDDLLSDLAHLSPKAAAAVEATWGAGREDADEDVEPATEAVAEAPAGEGEDLDQNLLLRFLSSAKH